MLKHLRSGSKRNKAIWWALIIITVVTFLGGFVFLFGAGLDSGFQARSTGSIAVVNGQRITQQEYSQSIVQQHDDYRRRFNTEPQGRDQEILEVQAWRGLVNTSMMMQEAKRAGLKAYDTEVLAAMRVSPPPVVLQHPQFQTEGRFDPQKYAEALRSPDVNWAGVEEIVRSQLPIRKLQENWAASIKVTQPELRMAFQERYERVTLAWVRVPPVTEGNVPALSDTALRQAWERHRGEYSGASSVKLEMLAVPKPITDAEIQAVRAQAEDLVRRARGGESFADLARAYSVGPYAEQGGALDRTVTGPELGPALAPILPRMKVGDVTDPQQEGPSFFLFRLDSLVAGPMPGYRLSQILLRARPDDTQLTELVGRFESIRARAGKAGLGAAAAEKGMATQQTAYFDWNGTPPQLYAVPGAAEWGLTAPLKAVSGIMQNEDMIAVVQVIGRRPAGPRPFEEVRDRIRSTAEIEARVELARPRAAQLAELMTAGKTLEQAAQQLGLSVDRSTPFSRREPDPRLGGVPEVVGAAFGLDEGGVAGPLRGRDGWYFLRVEQRLPPDEQAFETLKGQITQQIVAQKQQLMFASWVAQMRDRAKVQDLRGELGIQ
jgi:peptidyl-prolyl cis-trans isomerase D